MIKVKSVVRLRTKNITTIQYILVSDGSPIISPILPPNAFKNSVIDFIKSSPLDILQIIDSLNYLETYYRNLWSYGYDFHIFNIADYNSLKEFINTSKQVQLFFLNGGSKKHLALYEELKSNKSVVRFFHFYNLKENEIKEYAVSTPIDFIQTIIQRQFDILEFLKIQNITISPSVDLNYKDTNEFYYFTPTRINYFLLNKIIGNFGNSNLSQSDEEIITRNSEESKKAQLNKKSFERQKLFLEQIKKIDFFLSISYAKGILKPISNNEPYLSPLILVLPFHNPDLKDIYENNELTSLLQVEQTENYINEVQSIEQPELVFGGMGIQRERIVYLDDVSFLHSSFTFSPVIRLPIKGKSIYRELSFLSTRAFPNLSLVKNRRKLKKTIYNFGKILVQKTIAPELERVIKKRDGQIVAISDLPIEWLLIDGIPLSFTHDICRLPETSLHGLMSFYTYNQTIEYSVPTDIIKKTLVILGSHDESFKKWHSNVYELSKEYGFFVVECNNLNDVKQAVQSIKPELLIFDCHGGYNEVERSTYLNIGNEKLDGHYVVKNKIFAPMIFLSACGTAPTYGTMNPIANAFFEVGAISVTSTYLPINIDTGAVLYIRVLNNLIYAANHTIHRNWLNFICHVIRTSSINDAYILALNKKPDKKSDDFVLSNVYALTESMIFSKRRDLYNSLDKKISTLTNTERLYYSEVIPEYLLYSNLGRGDLILFDKWKEDYIKLNGIN